jgi:hypothetical protein
VVGKKKLIFFADKFGPCTLMGISHKKDQEWGVSSLIPKVNGILCLAD